MIADVERKGAPSKWLTLRALTVLGTSADCRQAGDDVRTR